MPKSIRLLCLNTQCLYIPRIGRQKTMYLCVLILLGSSAGLVGMVEYVGFCVLLFVIGGATLGLYMTAYVMSEYDLSGAIIQKLKTTVSV